MIPIEQILFFAISIYAFFHLSMTLVGGFINF